MGEGQAERMLCIDPGNTTGWTLWAKRKLLGGGQTPLGDFPTDVWDALAHDAGPLAAGQEECLRAGVTADDNAGPIGLIVMEKFALYPWKAKELSYDEMRTSQLIGAIKFIAAKHDVRVEMQPASIKERALAAGGKELFVTPEYENRHQNDSVLHGMWYGLTQELIQEPA